MQMHSDIHTQTKALADLHRYLWEAEAQKTLTVLTVALPLNQTSPQSNEIVC